MLHAASLYRTEFAVLRLLLGCVFLFFAQPVTTIADIYEDAASLGRGINMGNSLDAPQEGEWGITIEAEHFQLIREAGFDSVRIPIRWSTHTAVNPDTEGKYAIDADFLHRVDAVISQAQANDLNVVINVHHYNALNRNPTGKQRARYLSIWKQIAHRYRKESPTLFLELLNEPKDINDDQLDAAIWNTLLLEALAIVRQHNPTRAVIVGGSPWNSIKSLSTLQLPKADRRLIGTFHYYEPLRFTHQGAAWAEDVPEEGSQTWTGTNKQKRAIQADFDRAQKWSKKNKRPLYLGEFGAYGGSKKRNPMEDRARWTAFVRQQAELRGFSWSYWEFGAEFGAYDRATKKWIAHLHKALIPSHQ